MNTSTIGALVVVGILLIGAFMMFDADDDLIQPQVIIEYEDGTTDVYNAGVATQSISVNNNPVTAIHFLNAGRVTSDSDTNQEFRIYYDFEVQVEENDNFVTVGTYPGSTELAFRTSYDDSEYYDNGSYYIDVSGLNEGVTVFPFNWVNNSYNDANNISFSGVEVMPLTLDFENYENYWTNLLGLAAGDTTTIRLVCSANIYDIGNSEVIPSTISAVCAEIDLYKDPEQNINTISLEILTSNTLGWMKMLEGLVLKPIADLILLVAGLAIVLIIFLMAMFNPGKILMLSGAAIIVAFAIGEIAYAQPRRENIVLIGAMLLGLFTIIAVGGKVGLSVTEEQAIETSTVWAKRAVAIACAILAIGFAKMTRG